MTPHLRRPAMLLLSTVALSMVVGCSSSGGGSSTSTAGAAGTGAASPSPRQTQSAPAAPAPAAGGDFCTLTSNQLDAARGWQKETVSAADYIAALDRSAANPPAEIRDQVARLTTFAKTGVQELTTGVQSTTTPTFTLESLKGDAQVWRDWTTSHCSPDIAAKWDPKNL
ncbi:MAG: hypothetical protein KBF43_08515 [Dermatophilaceae bacterium]|jgi:protein-tyrosine-phosphatase|nr:hypothetical protein [Dermatophilaceae bacterium]MBP9918618.1 hypothetical protein [Dermatophilaceae bacterium]